jgi:hypothetical protein
MSGPISSGESPDGGEIPAAGARPAYGESPDGGGRPGWRRRAADLAGIDLRSLAVLRGGLGAVILFDLASRAADLGAHYTDAGVLPRSAALVWLPREAHLSVYMLSGALWYQALLFGITALAAAAMALGYHTRAATILSWYLAFALEVRNPAVDHGGDTLLRMVLFWAMFLPLGARWSLDRAAGRLGEPPSRRVVSVAAVAARLQLCMMYWMSAAAKWNPVWLGEGTALGTALRLDYLSTRSGRLLLRFPGLLRWLTRATVGLEALGPIAAWSPFFTGPLRSLVVLAFVLLHLCGMAPAFRLGTFPWVCAVAWSLMLPEWLWDRLAAGRLGGVMAALDRRDLAGAAIAPGDIGRRHARFAAAGRRLADGVAALLLLYVVLLNLSNLPAQRYGALLPPATNWLAETLALHQRWDMFAPRPPTDDGWPVAAARTAGGAVVDAWREIPLDLTRPARFATVYGDSRWTKYLTNLRHPSYVFHRRLFGSFLCRRWNAAHTGPDRLERLTLVYMLERTVPPDRELPAEPLVLFAQACSER